MNNEFTVPHNVMEEAKFIKLSLSAQMFYIHLCKIRNRIGKERFFRSLETLSKETGMHENTLKKAKRELVKAQYIGVERSYYKDSGFRAADVYHLNGYRSNVER